MILKDGSNVILLSKQDNLFIQDLEWRTNKCSEEWLHCNNMYLNNLFSSSCKWFLILFARSESYYVKYFKAKYRVIWSTQIFVVICNLIMLASTMLGNLCLSVQWMEFHKKNIQIITQWMRFIQWIFQHPNSIISPLTIKVKKTASLLQCSNHISTLFQILRCKLCFDTTICYFLWFFKCEWTYRTPCILLKSCTNGSDML